MSPEARRLPLAGVRVVEFTHMVMGPTCGLILADLGAEVIKVEPLAGDNTRRLIGAGAGFFAMASRNKKSLAVDVKDPRGREIVLKLVAGADVFSENFKDGAMERLGFGPADCAALNPRLVYGRMTGWGQDGRYRHKPGFGTLVEAMSGFASRTGFPDREPILPPLALADMIAGVYGAFAVTTALRVRDQGKAQGQHSVKALHASDQFGVGRHIHFKDDKGFATGHVAIGGVIAVDRMLQQTAKTVSPTLMGLLLLWTDVSAVFWVLGALSTLSIPLAALMITARPVAAASAPVGETSAPSTTAVPPAGRTGRVRWGRVRPVPLPPCHGTRRPPVMPASAPAASGTARVPRVPPGAIRVAADGPR